MEWLAAMPDTLFDRQAVSVPGTSMSNTLTSIDQDKLLELPVAEESHMKLSLEMALNCSVPISILPAGILFRWQGINSSITSTKVF